MGLLRGCNAEYCLTLATALDTSKLSDQNVAFCVSETAKVQV